MSSARPIPVLVALGSNLGSRRYELERAITEMGRLVRVVRVSPVFETTPVDSPPGARDFLNMVIVGWTKLSPTALLEGLHEIESERGRARRMKNEPRRLDLDLILYGAHQIRTAAIEVPHPRYRHRAFVVDPIRVLGLPWVDPSSGEALATLAA